MADEIDPPAAGERRPVPHVRDAVKAATWAITEEAMATIVAIVERENTPTLEALEAYRAKRVAGSDTMSIRDGVAIINVAGPLMRYADFFSAISGATSYEELRTDLAMAVDKPDVRAILLNIDSPGGMVNGANELADAIRAASAVKPVEAYVGHQAASAAYWVAAATGKITMEASAMVGSIGVIQGIRDTSERDAKSGVKTVQFVSSQSPNKVIDHNAPAGQKKIQKMVDDLAAVFVSSVAKHRGITPEAVIDKFGGGGIKVGAEAVQAGMADAIGSFEGTLKALASSSITSGQARGFRSMSDDKTHTKAELDTAATTAQATGRAEAQARIKDILALDEAKGRREQAEHLAFDTDLTVAQAKGILARGHKEPDAAPTGGRAAPAGGDAQGRAKDAAGGLAMAGFTTEQQGQGQGEKKPEPKAISHTSIYGKMNENVR